MLLYGKRLFSSKLCSNKLARKGILKSSLSSNLIKHLSTKHIMLIEYANNTSRSSGGGSNQRSQWQITPTQNTFLLMTSHYRLSKTWECSSQSMIFLSVTTSLTVSYRRYTTSWKKLLHMISAFSLTGYLDCQWTLKPRMKPCCEHSVHCIWSKTLKSFIGHIVKWALRYYRTGINKNSNVSTGLEFWPYLAQLLPSPWQVLVVFWFCDRGLARIIWL